MTAADETDNPSGHGGEEFAALKAADAAVRRALVEWHRDFLAFLERRLGNREEAEEVLQRFSVRALERATDLNDVRSVRGWLGRILATAIVDHQRRAIRRRRREVVMEPEALDRASEAIMPDAEVDGIICDCLYKVLPTLRPDHADVIWRADTRDDRRAQYPRNYRDRSGPGQGVPPGWWWPIVATERRPATPPFTLVRHVPGATFQKAWLVS